MKLINKLKTEFAKPENKTKVKITIIESFIFIPLLILYAIYWVQFTIDMSNYILTFRPQIEQLTTIESTYWVVSGLITLLGGLVVPLYFISILAQSLTEFLSIKMKLAKKKSHCNICNVRLKAKDKILIENYIAYHYSCYSKQQSFTNVEVEQ